MNDELANMLYEALQRNYPEREYEITKFSHHFPEPKNWGLNLDREELEALVLLPEQHGAAKIERMSHSACVYGFLIPEYTEEGKLAIISAYAKRFAEANTFCKKYRLIVPVETLLPEDMHRFSQHRTEIIKGIATAEFGDPLNKYDDAGLENLSHYLNKMGFEARTDREFVQTLWNKAKQCPTGQLYRNTWELFSSYLMEKNPEIVTNFDYIRRGVSANSLAALLQPISVNFNVKTPSPEHRSIIESIDETITH